MDLKKPVKIIINKYPKLYPREQFRAGVFNRITAFLRKPPEFMLIGSPKCGSTSLEYYISQHPDVQRLKRKEIGYFDWELSNGYGWYMSFFPLKWSKKITGDFSPTYLNHPTAVYRIKKQFPDMKFIITLRNPIDRAFSDYNMHYRRGYETLSFQEAIEKENERLEGEEEKITNDPYYKYYNFNHFGYLQKGLYYKFIKKWFEFYPKKKFLIIDYDQEFHDLPDLMTNIFKFLELRPFTDIHFEKQNVGTYEPMDVSTRKKLQEYYSTYNYKLNQLLGTNFHWE